MSTISQIAALPNTLVPLVLFDIISAYDATVLRLSTVKTVFVGNTYLPLVLSITGFDIQLQNSQLGVAAIPEVGLVLGNADASMSAWDNAHFFKNARMVCTFVFHDPATGQVGSSDSLTVFLGICNTPDNVTDKQCGVSAFNRFNSPLLLIPASRVSQLSQTIFPAEGKTDADIAASTDPLTAAYAWNKSESDRNRQDWMCGYGPLRGSSGFSGANPVGNYKLAATSSPTTFTSNTIGKTGLGMTVNGMIGHIVVITSGPGAGQSRRIASNTATVITVAKPFTTAPTGSSQFAVLYGYCGHSKDDCKARGMFEKDSSNRITRRFRGISIAPDSIVSRLNQTKGKFFTDSNQAKYNQVIPRVYGKVRIPLAIMFTYYDNKNVSGHLFACEGEIQGASDLIIENKLIPIRVNQSPSQEQTTGDWLFVAGGRGTNTPELNDDNVTVHFPGQDPYNLFAIVYLHVLPLAFVGNPTDFGSTIIILGRKMETLDKTGASLGWSYSTLAGWVLLDLLKDTGWPSNDINLKSWHSYSVYASQLIKTDSGSGNFTNLPRFGTALYINQQRSAAEVISGVMGTGRMILSFDKNAQLRLDCENKLTNTTTSAAISSTGVQFVSVGDGAGISVDKQLVIEQGGGNEETVTVISVKLLGNVFQVEANFTKTHSSGVTVKGIVDFDFNDSNILHDNGISTLLRGGDKSQQVPNEYTVEFVNTLRSNIQDSASLLDTVEATEMGAKFTGQLQGDGFPTFDQALRAERLALYRNHGRRGQDGSVISRGNLTVQLATSVKGIFIPIGGLVTVTNAREGWNKKMFRVVAISPSVVQSFPYWRIQYVLREHDDGWYDDINGDLLPATVSGSASSGPSGPGNGSGGRGGPITRVSVN